MPSIKNFLSALLTGAMLGTFGSLVGLGIGSLAVVLLDAPPRDRVRCSDRANGAETSSPTRFEVENSTDERAARLEDMQSDIAAIKADVHRLEAKLDRRADALNATSEDRRRDPRPAGIDVLWFAGLWLAFSGAILLTKT